jgi:hypothetical protein
VRGDRLSSRLAEFSPRPLRAGELSERIGELVQKLGMTSIAEIDGLIAELQTARNYLKAEADRIEQDMVRYAHLNATASASVKHITENFGQWRKGSDAAREEGAGGTQSEVA